MSLVGFEAIESVAVQKESIFVGLNFVIVTLHKQLQCSAGACQIRVHFARDLMAQQVSSSVAVALQGSIIATVVPLRACFTSENLIGLRP